MVRLQPGGQPPGQPMVVRNALVTVAARDTATRSWFRMILLTAATVSGVSPGARAARTSAESGRAATASR